jgi:hypothetical protein
MRPRNARAQISSSALLFGAERFIVRSHDQAQRAIDWGERGDEIATPYGNNASIAFRVGDSLAGLFPKSWGRLSGKAANQARAAANQARGYVNWKRK